MCNSGPPNVFFPTLQLACLAKRVKYNESPNWQCKNSMNLQCPLSSLVKIGAFRTFSYPRKAGARHYETTVPEAKANSLFCARGTLTVHPSNEFFFASRSLLCSFPANHKKGTLGMEVWSQKNFCFSAVIALWSSLQTQ